MRLHNGVQDEDDDDATKNHQAKTSANDILEENAKKNVLFDLLAIMRDAFHSHTTTHSHQPILYVRWSSIAFMRSQE